MGVDGVNLIDEVIFFQEGFLRPTLSIVSMNTRLKMCVAGLRHLSLCFIYHRDMEEEFIVP